MIDDFYFGREGEVLTGKVPIQVNYSGDGDRAKATAACAVELRAFLTTIRLGALYQLRRDFIVPGVCTATFTHIGGVTQVSIRLVSHADSGDADVGFLVRVGRAPVSGTMPSPSTWNGLLAPGRVGANAEAAGYRPLDSALITLDSALFPHPSLVGLPKLNLPGTVDNLVLVTVTASGLKFKAVPETTTPVAGNLIALNSRKDRPLLSASLDLVGAALTVHDFVYGGVRLTPTIPPLVLTLLDQVNVPTRMYVLHDEALPAAGVVLLAAQVRLYAFVIGEDTAWRSIDTSTITGPQNVFGSTVTLSGTPEDRFVQIGGSNAAGVCSSFVARVVAGSTTTITGTISPMGVPHVLPGALPPPACTWGQTHTLSASAVSATGHHITSGTTYPGMGTPNPNDVSYTFPTISSYDWNVSDTATYSGSWVGRTQVTNIFTGGTHYWYPNVTTTTARTSTSTGACETVTMASSGTASVPATAPYFDNAHTVTYDYQWQRLDRVVTSTASLTTTRVAGARTDSVAYTRSGSTHVIVGTSGDGLSHLPVDNAFTPLPTAAADPADTTDTTDWTYRSRWNTSRNVQTVTAADELAYTGYVTWDEALGAQVKSTCVLRDTKRVVDTWGYTGVTHGLKSTVVTDTPTVAYTTSTALPSRLDPPTLLSWEFDAYDAFGSLNQAPTLTQWGAVATITSDAITSKVVLSSTEVRNSNFTPAGRINSDVYAAPMMAPCQAFAKYGGRPAISLPPLRYNDPAVGTGINVFRLNWADYLISLSSWTIYPDSADPSGHRDTASMVGSWTYSVNMLTSSPTVRVSTVLHSTIGALTGTHFFSSGTVPGYLEYSTKDTGQEPPICGDDVVLWPPATEVPVLDVVLYDPRTKAHLVQRLTSALTHECFVRVGGTETNLSAALDTWLKSRSTTFAQLGEERVYIQPYYEGAALL